MNTKTYAEKIRRRKKLLKQAAPGSDPSPKKKKQNLRHLIFIVSLTALAVAAGALAYFLKDRLVSDGVSYDLIFFIGVPVALILALIIIWFTPKFYVGTLIERPLNHHQSEFDREKERLKLEDDSRKTVVQLVGGAFFVFSSIFTYNTLLVNQESQITDRFTKAVQQLGGENIEIRLGGLYGLERISKDSPKDYWSIVEILSAYIRERSDIRKKNASAANTSAQSNTNTNAAPQDGDGQVPTDIQTALTIIGRRVSKRDPDDAKIDLSFTNLAYVNLYEADLESVRFYNANLTSVNFYRARLGGAHLEKANLSGANLQNADLTNAELSECNLQKADLSFANLKSAAMGYADLRGADLSLAKDVTLDQLKGAIVDESTKLPKELEDRRQELLTTSQSVLKVIEMKQSGVFR